VCCYLQSKYAAESAVDLAHQSCREAPGFGVQIGLIEGDQGSDLTPSTHSSPSEPCLVGHSQRAKALPESTRRGHGHRAG
jgi:hypothetical protein